MRINHDLLFLDKDRLDINGYFLNLILCLGKLMGQAQLFNEFKTINSCTFNKES